MFRFPRSVSSIQFIKVTCVTIPRMADLPSWWTDAASPFIFVVIGAAVSLYATVVLERYNRFKAILRKVNHARRRAELYPLSVSDLERAHGAALDYWHLLEHARDDMDAEGQHQAAKRVGRLVSFVYAATAKIESMLNDTRDQDRRGSVPSRLSAFQAEFNRIKNDEFTGFEDTVKGEPAVFLKPMPQKLTADSVSVEVVDYFEGIP
jgi:hypothetical protein